MSNCFINQTACSRDAGNPICPKCGMDERVMYPGQADREAAQERAEFRYWKAHALELELKLLKPPSLAPPSPSPKPSKAVAQALRDAPFAPDMVVLPSGKFWMGCPYGEPGRNLYDHKRHEVTISYRLAMGKYPVTFEEWDAYVADGGTTYKPSDEGWGRGRRPVINVSWEDAQRYVAWLNQKLGIAADDPSRYRLPGEAEWEYACRAGTTGMYSTPDGLMSEDWANYNATLTFEGAPKAGRKLEKTTPVGIYPANPWGMYDMHGNVCEWMQDSFDDCWYEIPNNSSAWESRSPHRVLRGGSWCGTPPSLRSANRLWNSAVNRLNYLGFRLARTVS